MTSNRYVIQFKESGQYVARVVPMGKVLAPAVEETSDFYRAKRFLSLDRAWDVAAKLNCRASRNCTVITVPPVVPAAS